MPITFSLKNTNPRYLGGLVALVAIMFASIGHARWASPKNVPVDRLITNITKYVTENPDDAQGHYILGRVHSLAFTMKSPNIGVWSESKLRRSSKPLPEIADRSFQFRTSWELEQNPELRLPEAELRIHLKAAIESLSRAVELDANVEHYELTLAYTLELGSPFASYVDSAPDLDAQAVQFALNPINRAEVEAKIDELGSTDEGTRKVAEDWLRKKLDRVCSILVERRDDENKQCRDGVRLLLMNWWQERAREHYYLAHTLAIKDDRKINEKPMRGLGILVSYEAGNAYLRLSKVRRDLTPEDEERIAEVETGIATLNAKPDNMAITPIILSINQPRTLNEMTSNETPVYFDLNGDGSTEYWPWITPGTGFLVWDPQQDGAITSGQQMFGSVSWWMFFTNGYDALAALDDNQNGEIAGLELQGLAVWFDHNSNGISECGEVIPVHELGIAGLATECEPMTDDASLVSPYGLRLTDGRILPTYDWVTESMATIPPPNAETARTPIHNP